MFGCVLNKPAEKCQLLAATALNKIAFRTGSPPPGSWGKLGWLVGQFGELGSMPAIISA